MAEKFAIAAFRSRQQVMYMVSALRRMGLPAAIVTTPRAVATGCGLSVRFDPALAHTVADTARNLQAGSLIGLYLVQRDEQGRITCERLGTQP